MTVKLFRSRIANGMEYYQLSKEHLIELIDDVIAEFSHLNCPNCRARIYLDLLISRSDIEQWVDGLTANI